MSRITRSVRYQDVDGITVEVSAQDDSDIKQRRITLSIPGEWRRLTTTEAMSLGKRLMDVADDMIDVPDPHGGADFHLDYVDGIAMIRRGPK